MIFDYTKKRFICYEIRKTKDRVLVDSRDYTEQIKDAVATEEKDIAFLQIIKQALVRGVTATVYLCGEGFEGSWFKQSTESPLCLGRRVFMSKHLFACGAVYLCENDKHVSRDEVVFAQKCYDQSDRAGRASPWKRYVLSFDHGWKAMERKPWRD